MAAVRACSRGSLLETWLLMEYADRGSLSDALRSGRFPLRDYNAIYRCLLDIASGATLVSSMQSPAGDDMDPIILCQWLMPNLLAARQPSEQHEYLGGLSALQLYQRISW